MQVGTARTLCCRRLTRLGDAPVKCGPTLSRARREQNARKRQGAVRSRHHVPVCVSQPLWHACLRPFIDGTGLFAGNTGSHSLIQGGRCESNCLAHESVGAALCRERAAKRPLRSWAYSRTRGALRTPFATQGRSYRDRARCGSGAGAGNVPCATAQGDLLRMRFVGAGLPAETKKPRNAGAVLHRRLPTPGQRTRRRVAAGKSCAGCIGPIAGKPAPTGTGCRQ